MGIDRIAASQAVSAHTALAVFWQVVSRFQNKVIGKDMLDGREQQGVSDGHCVPPPQVAWARTEGAKAAKRRRKRMMVVCSRNSKATRLGCRICRTRF